MEPFYEINRRDIAVLKVANAWPMPLSHLIFLYTPLTGDQHSAELENFVANTQQLNFDKTMTLTIIIKTPNDPKNGSTSRNTPQR